MIAKNSQVKIISRFIVEFAPAISHRRKNTCCEFLYIYSAISKIFSEHMGLSISKEELLCAFIDLNYSVAVDSGLKDEKNNISTPGGKISIVKEFYQELLSENFIYVGVCPKTIRLLKKSSVIFPHRQIKNFIEIQRLIDDIKRFKRRFSEDFFKIKRYYYHQRIS